MTNKIYIYANKQVNRNFEKKNRIFEVRMYIETFQILEPDIKE